MSQRILWSNREFSNLQHLMNTLSTKSFSSKLPVSLAEKNIFLMYSVLTRAGLFKAGLVQNFKSDMKA